MMTLQQAIDDYLAARASLHPKTLKNYRYCLTRFAEFSGHAWPPARESLAGFFAHLRALGLKDSTVRTFYCNVKTFVNWLLDLEYLDKNPFRGVRPAPIPKLLPQAPGLADIDKLISYLESEVESALLAESIETPTAVFSYAQIHIRDLAIFSLMLDTGLRVGEVERLTVADIDLDNHTAFVRESKTYTQRTVDFVSAVAGNLKLWLDVRAMHRPALDTLFLNRNEGQWQPHTHWAIRVTLRRLCERLGLNPIRPHALRHAYATISLDAGAPLQHVQRQLGHKHTQTTFRYTLAAGLGRSKELHAATSPYTQRQGA